VFDVRRRLLRISVGIIMNNVFININRKLDTYMQDEWNATIPFSEEGGELADTLIELIGPGGVVDGFEVVTDETRKGWGPNDEIKVVILQSKDIMYYVFGEGDSHSYYATITRRYLHDHGQDYPYGVTESAIYYDENGM